MSLVLALVLFYFNRIQIPNCKGFPYNSRILNTQEQKFSNYDREFCAVTFALTVYEFIIIGSKFPIILLTDHNPLLFLFTRKDNFTPRQNKVQMLLTQFSNLRIIHTAGGNLAFADMLSHIFSTINSNSCLVNYNIKLTAPF